MKKYVTVLAVILLMFGCKKEKPNEISTSEKCITGNWNCTLGIELINNDTIELFQNGIKYKYWYGERKDTYTGTIRLQIDNNNYHFNENIEGYTIDSASQEIYNYILPWKLLNTTKGNTLLNMKIYFEYPQMYLDIFKITEISDTKLVIESNEDIYYMKYIFERTNECTGNSFTQETIQKPQEIIGNWKLKESLFETNDTVFTKFINDTLSVQYFIDVESDIIKVVDKYLYSRELKINEFGDVLNIEVKNNEIINNHSYWYWTDEDNPHNRIKFRTSFTNHYPICDYEITTLNENELIIKNDDYNIEFKFIKN